MNQKRFWKSSLAIGLIIILIAPFVVSTNLTADLTEKNFDVQEIELKAKDSGCFIENKGQIGNDLVLFYSEIPGGTIGFAQSKVLLWSHNSTDVVELTFPDSASVCPKGITPVSQYFNYLLGHRGTFTHLRGFESVVYEGLWSGIDLVYKDTLEGAKYEFRVAPGADPSDIKVQCEGHDELVIGDVDISITKDEIMFRDVGLIVTQDDDRAIQAQYLCHDDQTYGVAIGEYDQSKALIVDPLIFSTYIGGGLIDVGYSTAVDDENNIFVAGWSYSSGFPMMSPYNDTYGGNMDIIVAKLSPYGVLLYSTFIGGSVDEYACGIEIDDDGDIIVAGSSSSSDFPTTVGAMNETHNGEYDIVVLQLTSTGDELVFSTFLGGSGNDAAYDMTTRLSPTWGDHWIWVTGSTESSDYPVKQPAEPSWNSTYTAGRDIIVSIISPLGTFLGWSNIVGGSGDDIGYAIDLDDYWWTMVTGGTTSADLPTTNRTWIAYDEDYNGGEDAFCLGFNRWGDELGFLTYIGGEGNERAYGLEVEPHTGASFITGYTFSDDFPTTPDVYDRSYNSQGDVFVAKVSADGSELSFSTYIGGFQAERGNDIRLGADRNLTVVGRTASEEFPVKHAFDSTYNGYGDCFILRLKYDGKSILSSSFLGGSGEERINQGLVNSTNGNIVLVGGTFSTDFPTSGNQIHSDTNSGDMDVFVMTFTPDFSYPEITSLERDIEEPTRRDEVDITAIASDPEGVTEVTLQYRTDDTWVDVSMVQTPAGSGNWTATIPAQSVDTTVEYRAIASDAAGNFVVSYVYDYQVAPPPPLVIDQGILIALVSLTAAGLGIVGGLIRLRAAHIERSAKSETPKPEVEDEVGNRSSSKNGV